MTSINIIIVAAGSGLRFGAPLPKQFCELDGKPVVMHTVEAFRQLLPSASIILVLSREMEGFWHDLCKAHNFISPDIIHGGASRWESVRNAVITLDDADGITMVHDAVRPIVTEKLLQNIVQAMQQDIDGAIPAIAVTDSLREIGDNGRSESIERSCFRAVQTPQAFKTARLREAYSLPYIQSFTDDASVMEAAGFNKLVLTEGSPENIKITNPGDIAIASLYLNGLTR